MSESVLIALIARRVYFFCKKRKQALRMCVCPSFLSSIMFFLSVFSSEVSVITFTLIEVVVFIRSENPAADFIWFLKPCP